MRIVRKERIDVKKFMEDMKANRTKRAFALAILGADYILRWLPVGTHSWDRFVTPEEFAGFIHDHGLDVFERSGMVYNPLADRWSLSRDMAVNYMLAARREW